ncbi:MAG: prolipoprotein diacylglyceryl transferase family protein [Microgenomates group bacterium]
MLTHLIFDIFAAATCVGLILTCERFWMPDQPKSPFRVGGSYFPVLGLGILLGSVVLGSANLWLTGIPAIGRSILGALVGGVLAVEVYKTRRGITGSTGVILAPGFAGLVAVGRIGCALSGLEDNTYGTPTALPWSQDLGDGILRHPVAAYESLTMAAFLAYALWAIARKDRYFLRHGFYLMVSTYAAQRFLWEFLKPYAAVIGPFNLFHLACLGLLAYAVTMIRRSRNEPTAAGQPSDAA